MEKRRPTSKNSASTVREHLFVSPNLSPAVRQGGVLLSWNQRLERPPCLPQGPDCAPALAEPVSPARCTSPVPNEPALGVALCRGFRPHCRRRALRRLGFLVASHLPWLGGQWELPPCPLSSPLAVFSPFSGMCTHHFHTGQDVRHRTSDSESLSRSVPLSWPPRAPFPPPPGGPPPTIVS